MQQVEYNRTRTEIIIEILEAATSYGDEKENKKGLSPTTIVDKIFHSNNTQWEEHLKFLVEDGMLSFDPEMHMFRITEKGLTFLQAYKQIDQKLKEHKI